VCVSSCSGAVWSKVSKSFLLGNPRATGLGGLNMFIFQLSIFYRFKIKYFQYSRGYIFSSGNTLLGRLRPAVWFSVPMGVFP
jgi:hypothetical protein